MSGVQAVKGLIIRSWPGEASACVFAVDSVRTHLVSEFAAAVLNLARTRTIDSREAAKLLFADEQPVDSDGSNISADLLLMEETITGLVAAGLLRRME
jgi:hypothetical protein